ncbi:MAG: hypothetical protein KIT31_37495 [Deltaproteobacteria bacterium]|nr:hypothetical protein [Deltaproteobacteria bacterium]
MRGPSAALRIAYLAALAGCAFSCGAGGCDGARAKPPESPQAPGVDRDAGGLVAAVEPGAAVEAPAAMETHGYLVVPQGALERLNQALVAAERGDANARVGMLFFGDSHTAGDSMTSRLRGTFQKRFGDAGRGLVAAGKPTARHYYQRDVKYGATGQWKTSVGGYKDPEPYGICGMRIYGEKQGSQLWVETCAECPNGHSVGQFEIFYQAAPANGVLRYRVDDGPWAHLPTKTQTIEPPHPARHVIPVADGHHKLTIEHGGGGPLDLYGVALERAKPGVIVDSLGVVGRRLGSLRSWDWSVIGEQLATRDPRLVVLQYGTNEADDPDLDLEALARYYDDTILRIRAAAPTASILILGPPDMGVREGGKACDAPKKPPRGSTVDAGVIPECEWRTPAAVREIIAVEHAAAVRNKVAFFDTFAAMGGADRMDEWVKAEPRQAYKDHVHFTDVGYRRWADELSQALLAAYDRHRAALKLPPSSSK